MHPYMLYYVLYKSAIDIEPLSLTLHGVNTCFIHNPYNIENYLISHKSEITQPKFFLKILIQITYFCTFPQIFA